VWLALGAFDAAPRGRLLASGILAGTAVAFKLTMAPYVVALAAGLLVAAPGMATLTPFVLGAVAGYLLVGGYWCWQLWRHFGNPLFPFANQIFHSPFMSSTWLNDPNWRPHTIADYLRPPLDMMLGQTDRLREFPFRDPRYFLLALGGVALLGRRGRLAARERLLLTFFGVGYALWLFVFYYHRYMAPLEFLAPVALYVLLRALLPDRLAPRVAPIFGALAVLVTAATQFAPRQWGRAAQWRNPWFEVRVPRLGTMAKAAC